MIDPDIIQQGIPHLIHFGDFGGYKVLVITKAGPTLEELLISTKKRKFKYSTICKIAMQGVSESMENRILTHFDRRF